MGGEVVAVGASDSTDKGGTVGGGVVMAKREPKLKNRVE